MTETDMRSVLAVVSLAEAWNWAWSGDLPAACLMSNAAQRVFMCEYTTALEWALKGDLRLVEPFLETCNEVYGGYYAARNEEPPTPEDLAGLH